MNIDILKNSNKFFLIAGPCAVECKDICFEIAEHLLAITTKLNIPFVFKASYKKANRSKIDSFTTIGEDKALQILAEVKAHFNVPILTDVHETTDCEIVKDIVDIIQNVPQDSIDKVSRTMPLQSFDKFDRLTHRRKRRNTLQKHDLVERNTHSVLHGHDTLHKFPVIKAR